MRSRRLLVLFMVAAPLLAACTPPVPPEVEAFRAELNVPCGTGTITLSRPALYTDFVDNLVSNFTSACPDVTVNVIDPDPKKPVDIAITDQAVLDGCDVKIDTPLGYDGAAIVYSQSNIAQLDLSAATMSALLNGQISTWTDSRLTKDNPDGDFPGDNLSVVQTSLSAETMALNDWGKLLDKANWTDVASNAGAMAWDVDAALTDLANDNVVSVAPLSFAANNSLSLATIKDPHFSEVTYADVETATAGASQMTLESDETLIFKTVRDPSKPATPSAGADVASQPWGAVYPIHGLMCSSTTSTEAAQSFLRYGVRADQQEGLISYNLAPIPEDVRLKLAAKLNQGLHIPTDVPIPE